MISFYIYDGLERKLTRSNQLGIYHVGCRRVFRDWETHIVYDRRGGEGTVINNAYTHLSMDSPRKCQGLQARTGRFKLPLQL